MDLVDIKIIKIIETFKYIMLLGLIKSVSLLDMISEGQVQVLNEGDDVVLSCEFISYNFDLFNNPVLWRKTQRGEMTDINIMSNIKKPFSNTNRFAVSFQATMPTYQMDLTIINLSQEDSGNYSCEVRGPESSVLGQVTHYIFVRAHVESLVIRSSNSSDMLVSERSITFVEGENNVLRCASIGGYPPPEMRIYIGTTDISHQFKWFQYPKLLGRKGLRLMTYYSERYSYNFKAEPQYDGQEVTCAVNVAGYGKNNHTVTKLHVHYSPIITCYDATAEIGDTIVSVTCDIWAKPHISSSYWLIDKNGTIVSVPSVVNEYWTQVKEEDNGVTRSALYLHRTTKHSFKTYTLVAENDVGVTTHDVKLIQKIKPTKPTKYDHESSSRSQYRKKSNYYIYKPYNSKATLTRTDLYVTFVTVLSCIYLYKLNTVVLS